MTDMDNKKDTLEFYTVLNDCVDAVLKGNRTIEECLAAYPIHAKQLTKDLQMAVLVRRLKSPRMDSTAMAGLEDRLRAQIITPQKSKVIRFRMPAISRAAATILLMFTVLLAGSGGIVAASSNSQPGDNLYTVKRAWEGVIIAFHSITGMPEDIWLRLAETRLAEVAALSEQDHLIGAALHDLYEATERLIDETDPDAMVEVKAFLLRTETLITGELTLSAGDEAIVEQIMAVIEPAILALPPNTNASPQSPEIQSPTPPVMTQPPDIITPSPTHTASFTPSPTHTATMMATATPVPTETPRFPPTATRTPLPTSAKTQTPSSTPTPTATWTPFPSPTAGRIYVVPTAGTIQPATSPIPGQVTPTPSATWYPWVQATFDAEYVTQTAEAHTHQTSTAEATHP
jgi:hypothetical protein